MYQTRRRDRRLTNHLRRLLSNVPLHHIPQTGVIFLPCLPCGQRSSVPYFANGCYHSAKLVLRTATFRCTISRKRVLSFCQTRLADSNVPLHHIPQKDVIFLPRLPCGQRSSVPYPANGRCRSTKLVLRTAFLIIYVISPERQRVEKSRLTDRFLRACGYAALSRNDRM